MLSTTERLRTLHAEAAGKHARFKKLKNRRNALSNAISTTVAVAALATGVTAATGMPAAVTATLGVMLLAATGVRLALINTARDHDLYLLSDAWRRHRVAAGRLLARNGAQDGSDTAERIRHETIELEGRIADTHSDSLRVDPDPHPPLGGNG